MTSRLISLTFDAVAPAAVARFWSALLEWELVDDRQGGFTLLPNDDTGFKLRFVLAHEPKAGPNQMHFDLTSTSIEDQLETVDRALRLGGHHIDIGQLPEDEHVVLADPEGNEFCVIEPDNAFLADCGFIGAVSGDGSQATGYFWSRALGWPLVWDQDQETAIRSPQGGPKLTWGGPPLEAKLGPTYRPRLDLAPVDGDLHAEAKRLIALGATRADLGPGDWVALADPDGHEFRLLPAR